MLKHGQATVPLTGFALSAAESHPGQHGISPGSVDMRIPAAGRVRPEATAHLHVAEAVPDQAAADAAEQLIAHRIEADRAAAAQAAKEQAVAAHAAALAAAKAETAKQELQEQEALAIVAKEAATKRAEAEAVRAADRMARMQLDAEYVRYLRCCRPLAACCVHQLVDQSFSILYNPAAMLRFMAHITPPVPFGQP